MTDIYENGLKIYIILKWADRNIEGLTGSCKSEQKVNF